MVKISTGRWIQRVTSPFLVSNPGAAAAGGTFGWSAPELKGRHDRPWVTGSAVACGLPAPVEATVFSGVPADGPLPDAGEREGARLCVCPPCRLSEHPCWPYAGLTHA